MSSLIFSVVTQPSPVLHEGRLMKNKAGKIPINSILLILDIILSKVRESEMNC